MPIKIREVINYKLWVISFVFFLFLTHRYCYAAPCYGTKMPKQKQIFIGLESHSLFKRYLEKEYGKLRSIQEFFLLSYGVFDWLSLDLKVGSGNIRQHPVGSDEVDYPTSFSGGYGFRIKLYDKAQTKMVFGFQHISVHPKGARLGDNTQRAIVDDWQFSFLVSRRFFKITPYLGAKWSRTDYIHRQKEDRKRKKSDLTKDTGLVLGLDIPVTEKVWLNLEGQAFDNESGAFSLNFSF